MGREVPLTALIVARRTYGHVGAFLLSVLFTLVNAGWFGLNTAVGGAVMNALVPLGGTTWLWLIGAAQVVLVLFGMKWLEYFYRYTSAALVICYGALAAYLFATYHPAYPVAHGATNWGSALTLILSFSILAWTYKVSTVSRFCVPENQTHGRRRAAYFLAPSLGIMLAVVLMAVVGMYSQEAIGTWNVALLGPKIQGWGFAAAVGVALAIVHTNAMNLYPSTVDLLVAINTVHKPMRWEQPIATVLLGALSTFLAVWGILNHVQNFLNDIGDVVIPFTFIMLVDWIWVQRRRTPADAFFERPRTLLAWFNWPGALAFAVGFVISAFGQHFMPAIFYNSMPLPVVGGVFGAALYALIMIPWSRSAGHSSAASPQPAHPGEPAA